MPDSKKMSFEEWVEMGKEVKNIHLFILDLSTSYNKSSARGMKLKKATKAIITIKDVLDDCIFDEFPNEDGEKLKHVFYGE